MVKIAGTPTKIIGTATKINECCCDSCVCPSCNSSLTTGTSIVLDGWADGIWNQFSTYRYVLRNLTALNGTYLFPYSTAGDSCDIDNVHIFTDVEYAEQSLVGGVWVDGSGFPKYLKTRLTHRGQLLMQTNLPTGTPGYNDVTVDRCGQSGDNYLSADVQLFMSDYSISGSSLQDCYITSKTLSTCSASCTFNSSGLGNIICNVLTASLGATIEADYTY